MNSIILHNYNAPIKNIGKIWKLAHTKKEMIGSHPGYKKNRYCCSYTQVKLPALRKGSVKIIFFPWKTILFGFLENAFLPLYNFWTLLRHSHRLLNISGNKGWT